MRQSAKQQMAQRWVCPLLSLQGGARKMMANTCGASIGRYIIVSTFSTLSVLFGNSPFACNTGYKVGSADEGRGEKYRRNGSNTVSKNAAFMRPFARLFKCPFL